LLKKMAIFNYYGHFLDTWTQKCWLRWSWLQIDFSDSEVGGIGFW